MWLALLRLGVPEHLVRLLQSYHDNMSATILVNGAPVEGIKVCNGLHQGYAMAPSLFNLFAAAVIMERWNTRIRARSLHGLPMHCSVDGQLCRRSKRGVDISVSDGEFADDAVSFAASLGDAKHMLADRI